MRNLFTLLLAATLMAACSSPGTGPMIPMTASGNAVGATGAVVFDPPELNFGTRIEGQCHSHTVAVINRSGTPISSPAFELRGGHEFAVQQNFEKCADPLDDGASCRVYLNFCPPFNGSYQGELIFTPTGDAINVLGRGRLHK